jgi:hypothetical protein
MTLPALVELMGFETAVAPKDITGVAQVGDWMSLKNYAHVTIILIQGAWAGGTPAVTLNQATDVTGATSKPLSFTSRWVKIGLLPASTFGRLAVTNDSFTLPNTPNNITILEVNGDDLDVDNGYDCLSVAVASPGAFADLLTVLYVLSGARYPQAQMPDAKID